MIHENAELITEQLKLQAEAHHTHVLREAMQAQLISYMDAQAKDSEIAETLGMDLITKMQSQVVPDEAYVAMSRSIEQQVLKDAGKEMERFTEAAVPILVKVLQDLFGKHLRDNLGNLIKQATESKAKAYTNLEHSSINQLESMMHACADQMKRLTEAHDKAVHEKAAMRTAGIQAHGDDVQAHMADAFTYNATELKIK